MIRAAGSWRTRLLQLWKTIEALWLKGSRLRFLGQGLMQTMPAGKIAASHRWLQRALRCLLAFEKLLYLLRPIPGAPAFPYFHPRFRFRDDPRKRASSHTPRGFDEGARNPADMHFRVALRWYALVTALSNTPVCRNT